MGLTEEGLDDVWASDFIQKNPNRAYRTMYAPEYTAVGAYLSGGAEPDFSQFSRLGKGLCKIEKERRAGDVVVPPVEPEPPVGNLRFGSGFENADVLTEWTCPTTPAGRVVSVTAENGITPREGSRMLRSTVDSAIWLPGTNGALVQKSGGNMTIPVGNDVYSGLSFYLPNGFQPAPQQLANNIWEWHWTSASAQAPFHFGINTYNTNPPQFFCDLHTAASGYNPIFTQNMGPMVTGKWINTVLRFKGSFSGDGRYQFWMKDAGTGPMTSADLKKDYTGVTWTTAASGMYLLAGIYRAASSWTSVAYYDAVRVGDTLSVVDPGNRS